MANSFPSLAEWRRLYTVWSEVKELAPWTWMEESDLFGVQDPDTDRLGFVSVMGMLGQHYAVALYQGPEGLYGFWDMQDAGPDMTPEHVLSVPQLQASFEDRDTLEDKDRATIKKLDLKFRGRQAWPMFRSYRPGFLPWHLEADEARFLAHALEQVLDVAPRFKEDATLLDPSDDEHYLVRTPHRKGETLTWEDRLVAVFPPEPVDLDCEVAGPLFDKFKALPQKALQLEIDLFLARAVIREKKGDRPYLPYMLFMVDADSGFIMGTDLLSPIPSLEAMWEEIPEKTVTALLRMEMRPAEFHLRSPLLIDLLQPLADETGITIRERSMLPMLDEARWELDRFFGR